MASGVVTSFLLGNLVGTLPAGWFIDRLGHRAVLLAGPLFTAAVAFLVATSTSFPELLVLRFFNGVAAQTWVMARLATIADSAAPDQRGRQVSWMFSMDNTGKLTGPILGGFVVSVWGLRAPFVVYGALALITLAFVFTAMAAASVTLLLVRYVPDVRGRPVEQEPAASGSTGASGELRGASGGRPPAKKLR